MYKLHPDYLFTGSTLLPQGNVLVLDANGVVMDIVTLEEAGENVQHLHGILSPGFVNAHCHLELSHMQGVIPEHTGLVNFVSAIVTQRHFAEEKILEAIHVQEQAMINNGIVAVGDICNNTLTLSQKEQHRLAYHNFIEISGWNPLVAQKRLEDSLKCLDAFASSFPSYTSLSPHAPYSVSTPLWELMQPYFEGCTVTLHNQECAAENELFQTATGDFLRLYDSMGIKNNLHHAVAQNSLPVCLPWLRNAARVLLVHNSFTQPSDLSFLLSIQGPEYYICLCPSANLYIENTLPPIDIFLREGLNLVLGTDSLASNHQLSIWEEIKVLKESFPFLSLAQLLQWATLNGAKALHMDNNLGSFAPGKQPGLVLLEGVCPSGSIERGIAKKFNLV